jgi:hypothetical protein
MDIIVPKAGLTMSEITVASWFCLHTKKAKYHPKLQKTPSKITFEGVF